MGIKDWLAETGLHATEKKARAAIAQAQNQLRSPLVQTSIDAVRAALGATTQAFADIVKYGEDAHHFLLTEQVKVNTPAATQVVAQAQQVADTARQQSATIEQLAASFNFSQSALVHQQLQQILALVDGAPALLDTATAALPAMHTLIQQMEQQQAQAQALVQQRQQYLAQYGGVDPAIILQQLQAGTYTSVSCGILLHKGEIALVAIPAKLAEDRTSSQYVGGSTGVSVPVGYGVRFRVGSYRGHAIHQQNLVTIDSGTLIVTNQRIVFNGVKQSVVIPVGKVLSTTLYKNGISLQSETRKKREVMLCENPQLANTFVLIATQLATP